MKKFLKKIVLFVSLLPLMAVNVPNPAKGFFTDAFGTSFQEIILTLIRLLLELSGLIALAYIILGGYQILTARGNQEQSSSGRKTLTNAIIGLVIIILSFIIVSITVNALFGRVTNRVSR